MTKESKPILKTGTIKKIKSLDVGTVFNNYKEMCEILKMDIKNGGTSKKAQLKELERYVTLEKVGRTFTVKEVFKRAKPREDFKALQENLDILIKHYIYRELQNTESVRINEDNGKIVKYVALSKSKLARNLGLINENNYNLLKYNTEEYKQLMKDLYNIELHDEAIEDFIICEDSKQYKRLEKAANDLRNQRLVDIGSGRGIIYYKKNVTPNKDGKRYIELSRNCSDYEASAITLLEKQELRNMKLTKISEVYALGKTETKKFYKRVVKAINEHIVNIDEINKAMRLGLEPPKVKKLFPYKIKGYYSTYIFMYREELEKECYQYATIDQVLEAINKIAIKSCMTSINTKYNKKYDRLQKIDRGIGINQRLKEINTLKKILPSYKEESNLLTTETISKNAIDRTEDIKAIKEQVLKDLKNQEYSDKKSFLYLYIFQLENIFSFFRENLFAMEKLGVNRIDLKEFQEIYEEIEKYKDEDLLNNLTGKELINIEAKLKPLAKEWV